MDLQVRWNTGKFQSGAQLVASVVVSSFIELVSSESCWFPHLHKDQSEFLSKGQINSVLNSGGETYRHRLYPEMIDTMRAQLTNLLFEIFELNFVSLLKLHGPSPRAHYTDRATAACRRSDCQLARIEGATWSAWRIPPAVFSRFSRQEPLLFYQVAPHLYSRGWVDPVPDPLLFFFLVLPGIEPRPTDLQPRTLTTRPQRWSVSLLYIGNFKY
jgi:hypothetical protein